MNDLIRSSECVSCTITSLSPNGLADVSFANFRQARFDISIIILYKFEGNYYYPTTLEYRLIDNNVLYLLEELSIKSMEEVFRVLTSSMEKEEKWTNKFVLGVVHLLKPPLYCHRLTDITIDNVETIDVYE